MTKVLSIGNHVVIRTVTWHYIGRVAAIDDTTVTLVDASWLADSGRWGEFLLKGTYSEVEPFPDPVDVRLDTIVDSTLYRHELPRAAK
jgi:hypothetical protein